MLKLHFIIVWWESLSLNLGFWLSETICKAHTDSTSSILDLYKMVNYQPSLFLQLGLFLHPHINKFFNIHSVIVVSVWIEKQVVRFFTREILLYVIKNCIKLITIEVQLITNSLLLVFFNYLLILNPPIL